MRSNDLIPYLNKPATGSPITMRQGVVVSWNSATAENQILVGGSLMTNLKILNTSEAALLAPGNVVAILVSGGTWGILGRFTEPGSPEAVSALSSLKTQSASELTLDNITSTSFAAAPTPGPSVQIQVGATGRLLVLLTAEFTGQTAKAAANSAVAGGQMGFTLSGANTLAAASDRALVVSGNMLASSSAITFGVTAASTRAVYLQGLNPGLTTVTAVYRYVGNGTQISVDDRNISVLAI